MDKLNEIRARLDDWQRQKEIGTEGFWDGVHHYEPLLCADIAYLLSENEALREQIEFLHEEMGDSRLVVKSPQERVWEVWRVTRDEKVATFRTKREAMLYIEGDADA